MLTRIAAAEHLAEREFDHALEGSELLLLERPLSQCSTMDAMKRRRRVTINCELGQGSNRRRGNPASQRIDPPAPPKNDGKAAARAAKRAGTNRQYVADVAKLVGLGV